MVPAAYVILDVLPLTINGKLDVAALPVPDASALPGSTYVAPRSAIEKRLCVIWEQLLGVERVGVEDRFFELGGNSLHATQLVSRITRVFGVNVPLRVLFEGPTVASLAKRIGELEGHPIARQDGAASDAGERPRPRQRQRVTLGGDGALANRS
jgi:acyl carrier protein